MSSEYVTSETNLPENYEDGEIQLQISDKNTKEIFSTQAKVSRDPEDLDDSEPLTVVRGPHENIEEQWYIEILETDTEPGGVDTAVLESVIGDLEEDSEYNQHAVGRSENSSGVSNESRQVRLGIGGKPIDHARIYCGELPRSGRGIRRSQSTGRA
ncbi:hypothetical protein ACFQH2_11815 [Natronoarchaeum sp. GCM10025703]|uniref:hypothetical protein n=1 Tax=Natronoarchaeum sp. GCM10025703 TaxID=3252685 RepID=UPI0036217E4F